MNTQVSDSTRTAVPTQSEATFPKEPKLLNIKKILLPLDLLETSLPGPVIHQAAALARHFGAEILLLHVVKPLTYLGNGKSTQELLQNAIAREEEKLRNCVGPELEGCTVTRMVLKGDPTHEILRVAHDEKVDLIVMPTHGYGEFQTFLLGSATAKVIHKSECPVWTGARLDSSAGQPFAIRNILCAVDFETHSAKTIRLAQSVAAEFGAALTLAHVTAGVEIYGPGGTHVLQDMKRELVSAATQHMERIQRELGVEAAVFIGCGNVARVITQAAKDTKADLVIVGCRSIRGRLGTTAYGIIRESSIPVLTV